MLKPDLSFVHKYFMAEKQAALLFLIIGATGVVLGIIGYFFIKTNPNFIKGAAIPFFLVGLLMAIVGLNIYQRSDKQRLDISYKMGLEPIGFTKTEELPRMEKVMSGFKIAIYSEIGLIIAGLILFFIFRSDVDKVFWKGLGLSLAIISLVALLLDYDAEKRAKEYKASIDNLINQN